MAQREAADFVDGVPAPSYHPELTGHPARQHCGRKAEHAFDTTGGARPRSGGGDRTGVRCIRRRGRDGGQAGRHAGGGVLRRSGRLRSGARSERHVARGDRAGLLDAAQPGREREALRGDRRELVGRRRRSFLDLHPAPRPHLPQRRGADRGRRGLLLRAHSRPGLRLRLPLADRDDRRGGGAGRSERPVQSEPRDRTLRDLHGLPGVLHRAQGPGGVGMGSQRAAGGHRSLQVRLVHAARFDRLRAQRRLLRRGTALLRRHGLSRHLRSDRPVERPQVRRDPLFQRGAAQGLERDHLPGQHGGCVHRRVALLLDGAEP